MKKKLIVTIGVVGILLVGIGSYLLITNKTNTVDTTTNITPTPQGEYFFKSVAPYEVRFNLPYNISFDHEDSNVDGIVYSATFYADNGSGGEYDMACPGAVCLIRLFMGDTSAMYSTGTVLETMKISNTNVDQREITLKLYTQAGNEYLVTTSYYQTDPINVGSTSAVMKFSYNALKKEEALTQIEAVLESLELELVESDRM